jgi:hypothetical protein
MPPRGLELVLKSPYYELKDFVEACASEHPNVFVRREAEDHAREQFELAPKSELLAFIGAGEFQELTLDRTSVWATAPLEFEGMIVDSYTFVALCKRCYMAFGYGSKAGRWALKSFHEPSKEGGPLTYFYNPFRYELVRDAKQLPGGSCE